MTKNTITHRLTTWQIDPEDDRCQSIIDITEFELDLDKDYSWDGKFITEMNRIFQNATNSFGECEGLFYMLHREDTDGLVPFSPPPTIAPLGGWADDPQEAVRIVQDHLDHALCYLLGGRSGGVDIFQQAAIEESVKQLAGLFLDICRQNDPYEDDDDDDFPDEDRLGFGLEPVEQPNC